MKKVLLTVNDKFTVRGLVAQMFEAPMPSRTFSYKQAAEIVGILSKFRDAPEDAPCVILENSEHSLVKKTIEEFQFPFMNAELLEVLDTVVKAEEYKLQEVPSGDKANVS